MTYVDLIGWLAAALTFGAYSMRTMLPLRMTAICSNIAFASYGALTEIYPMLFLHLLLLPFNIMRLAEILRTGRKIMATRAAGPQMTALKPYMTRARLADGQYLFHRGDPPDRLYVLESGRLELEEIGVFIEAGELFGEIAFFTDAGKRTLSAISHGEVTVLAMSERDFMKLFYLDPSFGFAIVKLVAERLAQATAKAHGNPA